MKLLVKPLSLWLAYDITDPNAFRSLLPPDMTLASLPLLEDDRKGWRTSNGPKLLFNSYDVSSSWMKGHRLEIQTIARHNVHGTYHFVVLEVLTNSMNWDPERGVTGPNARCRLLPVGDDGYSLDVREPAGRSLCVSGTMLPQPVLPHSRFVVDCNLACYFASSPSPFPIRFDHDHVRHPVRRLAANATIQNTLWRHVRKSRPSHAFVHTRPMRFDVQVDGMWYDVF